MQAAGFLEVEDTRTLGTELSLEWSVHSVPQPTPLFTPEQEKLPSHRMDWNIASHDFGSPHCSFQTPNHPDGFTVSSQGPEVRSLRSIYYRHA